MKGLQTVDAQGTLESLHLIVMAMQQGLVSGPPPLEFHHLGVGGCWALMVSSPGDAEKQEEGHADEGALVAS